MSHHEIAAGLQAFLRRRCGDPAAAIDAVVALAGGASREIYGFDLRASGRPVQRLVLRMDPAPGRLESDRATEFALLGAAAAAAVSVPAVHWLGSPDDELGASFIVMDRVDGQAIARPLLRDTAFARTREALPAAIARELARIHAIDLDAPGLESLRSDAQNHTRDPAGAELERYRELQRVAADGHPQPVLVLVARWLAQHAPPVEQSTLVHGDFRVGNLMYDERGLTGVLDWELAHIGDPLEDIGWLSVRAWRYGAEGRAVGGLCSREHFWELYERESGRAVDPASARYWEVFGNWKWAVICMVQAASHRAGRYPNVELASLGRRVAEVEWELLALLDREHGGVARRVGPAARGNAPGRRIDMQDRPIASELLEAVAAFIAEEAVPALEGASRFHGLVAANVARIVAREKQLSPALLSEECERLRELLGSGAEASDETGDYELALRLNLELCRRIESGEADEEPWRSRVLSCLEKSVAARLAVDNPKVLDR